MNYDQFLELVKTRRSIRKFKSDPIPEDVFPKLVDAARWAPSGGNSQLWEFVVVRKPELKDAIANVIKEVLAKGPIPPPKPGIPPASFATAPAFILFLGDPRVKEYGPPPLRHADADRFRDIITSSLTAAYQQMALAAVTLGYASMWLSAVMRPEAAVKIKEILGIPEYMVMHDMLAVGKPDIEPAPKKMREIDEMIHYDACGPDDFRSEEKIKEFYS